MKLRPFELTLVVIFGILMVLALVLLKTYKIEPKTEEVALNGPVTIWGILPAEKINNLIRDIGAGNKAYREVSYRYISPGSFNQTFLNALADGTGPDLILLSQEYLVHNRGRFEPVPYNAFPLRDFRSLYVDGADIFALSDGLYAYPIMADPLMLYWNRDLLSFNNIIKAPTTWEEITSDIIPKLTIHDYQRSIKQSALAMGEFSNIKNALPIFSMLLLQGGSAMVVEDGGGYKIKLNESVGGGGQPLSGAATFYTNFNNVSNTLYSWNNTLPQDREQFLREQLALYFGFGSEARELEERNPNLSFDIALVPQGASATIKRTYARFYGLVVPRSAKNKIGAYAVRNELASQSNAKALADMYNMAPVNRSLLIAGSNDIYGRVIYEAMPTARGWLNPELTRTNDIFSNMLIDVSANRSVVSRASDDTTKRLKQLY